MKGYNVRPGDRIRRSDLQAVILNVYAARAQGYDDAQAVAYVKDLKSGTTWEKIVDVDNHQQKITLSFKAQ